MIISEGIRQLPVIVIGAGPVGLAAAAHLDDRGIAFEVFEAGNTVAANIAEWGHVRLFTPWKYLTERVAVRLRERHGWSAPNAEDLPTGAELIGSYLRPLAETPEIAPSLTLGLRVLSVARRGIDKVKTVGRSEAPFVVRTECGPGERTDVLAAAVLALAAFGRLDETEAIYQLVGSGLYLAGVVITGTFHVPRNNALEQLASESDAAAKAWSTYLPSWTRWNHVRAFTSLAASLALILSLLAT